MTNRFTRRTRLLLVDDDPSIVRLLKKTIERAFEDRIELTSLTDPEEACRWIERNGVDILLTDLEMPGIDGLELLRCAKRINSSTQVLFITGTSTLGALTDALELGAADYLLKPAEQAELIKLIDEAERRLRRWQVALAGTLAARHG